MTELTIKADGVFTGVYEYKVRIKPKSLNSHQGWDIWFEKAGKWTKKTRGNSIGFPKRSEDYVISKLLECGDYCLSKTLISVKKGGSADG